jgi:hypothetical protein
MPRAAIERGAVEDTLPLHRIAGAILARTDWRTSGRDSDLGIQEADGVLPHQVVGDHRGDTEGNHPLQLEPEHA